MGNSYGPITTTDSQKSGRLVVDAGLKSKKKKSLLARVKSVKPIKSYGK